MPPLHLQMQNIRYDAAPAQDSESLSAEARAAWFVEDATIGVYDPVEVNKKTPSQRETYIAYENMVHPERFLCVLGLTLVSFAEIPLWCLPRVGSLLGWPDAASACAAPGHIYLSGIDYLPLGVTLALEFACVSYLSVLVGTELRLNARDRRFALRCALTGLLAVDLAVFTTAVVGMDLRPAFRAAPYLRALLLAVNVGRVYESAEAVVALLPAFCDVGALLALCVAFFGWLAAITFDDLQVENREGVAVNEGFSSLGEGLYTMFFVSTTANFPDQMLPSFTYSRRFGIFFFLYVLLSVFVFLNLILAVVYNEYADFVKNKVTTNQKNRVAGLRAAFALLAETPADGGDPQITRDAFERLVAHTNDVERVPTVHAEEVDFFFSIMDDDHSGSISKAEFFDVCDILQYSFQRVQTTTYAQRHRPDLASSDFYAGVERFVTSPAFGRLSTAVLLVNVVLVGCESYMDLSNTLTAGNEKAWALVEMAFSCAYMALLCGQLLVIPWDEFWLSAANRFDFAVTLVLFGAAVFWVLPYVEVSRQVLHHLTILRLMRLVAFLNKIERFKLIAGCIVRIVPASAGVVGLLFVAGSLWAALGVQCFGGLVYDGNPDLDGSDYLDSNYDVLNFNDFAMGFLPLFAMVTSGGPYTEFVEALNDVSAFRGAGYVFFITFYVVGVLVCFNVFAAFVIDAFLSQYADGRALAHDAEADTLDQSRAGAGFRIVAHRRSAEDDVYKAMFLEEDEDRGGDGDGDVAN